MLGWKVELWLVDGWWLLWTILCWIWAEGSKEFVLLQFIFVHQRLQFKIFWRQNLFENYQSSSFAFCFQLQQLAGNIPGSSIENKSQILSTIIIQMISRIARLLNPIKLVQSQLNISSSSRLLSSRIRFSFNEDNKKPKPSNSKQDFIEAEMKPAQEAEKKRQDKIQDEDGVEPSKFGNSMLLASAIALALAYAYLEIQIIRANKKKKTDTSLIRQTGSGKAQIGGEWLLTDTEGKPFGSNDLAGTYYLIYFGFTHCPDICPNSLTKLSKAVARVKKTKEGKFFNLKTVFVSVDPDRDTPQKIKKFISLFDPEMIGVTANNNQDPPLRDCMKQYKFTHQKTVQKGRKSYTIDHTILTYLMSDTNEYLTHLGANLGEQDLANLIIEKIAEDKREKMQKLKV